MEKKMPKDRQYVVEYFDACEVNKGKAPIYTERILAVNLKDAKRQTKEYDNCYVILSVVPDTGEPLSKRKRKHILTVSDIRKVTKIYDDSTIVSAVGSESYTEDADADVGAWEDDSSLPDTPSEELSEGSEGLGAPLPSDCGDPDCWCQRPAPVDNVAVARDNFTACPCGAGIDCNGDGDCAACTSPVAEAIKDKKAVDVEYEQALAAGMERLAALQEELRGRIMGLFEPAALEPDPAGELETLKEEVNHLNVQLAGCYTAAQGWSVSGRETQYSEGDYGYSGAYQAVASLRMKYDDLLAAWKLETEPQPELEDPDTTFLRNIPVKYHVFVMIV
jgi:hypothetical protein